MNVEFILLFFFLIATAAFIARKVIGQRHESPTVEEIVSEVVPFLADPTGLHRKVVRDLRNSRIHGAGTIFDIEPARTAVTVRVRDRVIVDAGGTASEQDIERDIIFELNFIRPDEPDEARVGHYVEFIGILIDVRAAAGMPVLFVEPGEILYIGDEPPDTGDLDEEEPPETDAGL